MLMTNGNLPMTDAQKKALLDFVRGGKGFVGAHCAALTFYNYPEFGDMLGGYYRRSIRQNAIGVLKVEDPTHPATKMLGGSWPLVDEFYHFGTAPWDAARPKDNIDVLFGNHIPMGFSRDRVHVLLSLDTEKTNIDRHARRRQGRRLSAGVDAQLRQGPIVLHVARTSRRHLVERPGVPRPHHWRHPLGAGARRLIAQIAEQVAVEQRGARPFRRSLSLGGQIFFAALIASAMDAPKTARRLRRLQSI